MVYKILGSFICEMVLLNHFHQFECKLRISYSAECLFELTSVKQQFSTYIHFH